MNTERHGKSLISKTFFLPLILLQLLIHEPSLLRLKTTFPCPCDAGIQVQSYFSIIASIVAVKTPDNPAAFVKKLVSCLRNMCCGPYCIAITSRRRKNASLCAGAEYLRFSVLCPTHSGAIRSKILDHVGLEKNILRLDNCRL